MEATKIYKLLTSWISAKRKNRSKKSTHPLKQKGYHIYNQRQSQIGMKSGLPWVSQRSATTKIAIATTSQPILEIMLR